MSHTIAVERAAETLAELVAGLRLGDEIVLTRDDQPVARIVPSRPAAVRPRRAGSCKGMLVINQDDDDHLAAFAEGAERASPANGPAATAAELRGVDRAAVRLDDVGMKFRVTVEADEDGVFVAECPTLPGCVSQGDTREEALSQIKDAIAGYLFSLTKHDEPVPLPITEEVVEVSL